MKQQKRKRGRPKLDDPRTVIWYVRLSADEAEALEPQILDYARRTGIPPRFARAAWIRSRLTPRASA